MPVGYQRAWKLRRTQHDDIPHTHAASLFVGIPALALVVNGLSAAPDPAFSNMAPTVGVQGKDGTGRIRGRVLVGRKCATDRETRRIAPRGAHARAPAQAVKHRPPRVPHPSGSSAARSGAETTPQSPQTRSSHLMRLDRALKVRGARCNSGGRGSSSCAVVQPAPPRRLCWIWRKDRPASLLSFRCGRHFF